MNRVKIIIVGNGHLSQTDNADIDSSDIVVRFNLPPKEHLLRNPKTDVLVISNSSKQTKDLITNSDYLKSPLFSRAETLIFPYSKEVISRYMPKPNIISWLAGRRADLSDTCIKIARKHNKEYQILTTETYLKACANIGIKKHQMKSLFPSSGIMAIQFMIDKFIHYAPIQLRGFGFDGWKRHHWTGEKNYVKQLCDSGAIVL